MNRKIRIGYWDKSFTKPLRYPGQSHLILTAPARSGKGRDILIPALLEYEGSCIVIDPKGELACVTAMHRARNLGQRVLLLNPFHVWPEYLGTLPHIGFNPMRGLDPAAESFGADCDSLAEAIVTHDALSHEAHFTDSARQLVSGVIMRLASARLRAYGPDLVSLYKVISGSGTVFQFAQDAVATEDILVGGRLGRFAAEGAEENREIVSINSTAITQCGFIGNNAIKETLRGAASGEPELRFSDLRHTPTTVYLILPLRYLASCAKWFRLVIAAALADLLREEDRGPVPVLCIMDEFAQLGVLKVISDCMGMAAGMGLQLFPILQDLSQLQEMYPRRWETFLANSGAQIWFAPRDQTTAEYVSQRCGDSEVVEMSKSVSMQPFTPNQRNVWERINVNVGYGKRPRRFLLPHEVAALGGDEMLVFAEGIKGVIRGARRSYLVTPEFQGLYGPNPYHLDPNAQAVRVREQARAEFRQWKEAGQRRR